ncbi:MAG: hypothetical protein Q8Q60_03335 [Candidatus Chromulinivorax sp.]|nr:hypothetical protein [Candidatus Chromulinivorax sp.]
MKNLRIITLTAICIMTGMGLLEAEAEISDKHSMQFTNNTANPLSIECKSQYRKWVNAARRMRHDKETLAIPAGESKTWNYHTSIGYKGLPQYIKIKDTVSGKYFNADKEKSKNILEKLKVDEGNNIINADYTLTAVDKNGKSTIVGTLNK